MKEKKKEERKNIERKSLINYKVNNIQIFVLDFK